MITIYNQLKYLVMSIVLIYLFYLLIKIVIFIHQNPEIFLFLGIILLIVLGLMVAKAHNVNETEIYVNQKPENNTSVYDYSQFIEREKLRAEKIEKEQKIKSLYTLSEAIKVIGDKQNEY